MSDFEAIRDDLARFAESVGRQCDATARLLSAVVDENKRLWDEVAELHDGILALSNRIEPVARSAATPFDPPEAA